MTLESFTYGMCIAAVVIAAIPVAYLTLTDLTRARAAIKKSIVVR